jgi:hypothetical protein
MKGFSRAALELVPMSRARIIAKKDASSLSSNPGKYLKENLASYYVICNTWLMFIRNYSQYGWLRVGELACSKGLVSVISEADAASQELIRGDEITSVLFRTIVQDIMRPHVMWGMPRISDTQINQDPMATALQILRFPKRFSPLCADKVEQASIKSFLDGENRNKYLQSAPKGYTNAYQYNFPLLYTRDVMARLLDWDALCDDIEKLLQDPRICEFTPGVAFDAKTSLASKLSAVLNSNPEFFGPVMGVPLVGGMPRPDKVWYCATGEHEQFRYESRREVRVAAVPKSYKTARIIAMETAYRQARAHAVFSCMEKYLPKGIRLHDQTQNQRLARCGSLDGLTATLDQTAASDTITKSFFWEVFPTRFTQLVYPLLGTHHIINGKSRVMQMMATSGNSLTFILESLVFYAIDVAAHEFSQQVCGWNTGEEVEDSDGSIPVPSVYGDDQVIWSVDYDVTVHFLQALGFIVNESKSYGGNSPFRESCGTDWYLGVDVSSVYYPRRPLRGTVSGDSLRFNSTDLSRDSFTETWSTSLTSLISLQHRLYDACPDAALFLREIVKEVKPNITMSEPGARREDLWDYIETYRLKYAPGASSVTDLSVKDLEDQQAWHLLRKLHMLPSVAYPEDQEIPSLVRRLYDVYKYQEFLRTGPRYKDELSRLLGVTERPLSIEEVCGSPTVKWRWIEATEF